MTCPGDYILIEFKMFPHVYLSPEYLNIAVDFNVATDAATAATLWIPKNRAKFVTEEYWV